MGKRVKWTVDQVKKTYELDPTDVLYTKRIIPFIRKVTKDDILDGLQASRLLTKDIKKIIEVS